MTSAAASKKTSDSSSPVDVLVVGAGPGGLASALLMAGMGLRVTVVEKSATPGGRMGRIVEGGYAFDVGPTILQLPQILVQVFRRAGLRFEDYVDLVKVEPNTRIHFWDGSSIDTSTDRDANRSEWARLVDHGADRYDRYFQEHVAKYNVAYDRFIAHKADSIPDYFNPLRLLPAARFAPWENLHRSLMRTVGDERLAFALSYPSKYLGLHPTTCSSVFSVIAFLELAFGVWHPKGGFRALADAMVRGIEDLGGTVRFHADVQKILVEKGEARGVELTTGQRISARHVVVNADWAAAKMRLIAPEDRPSTSDRNIEGRAYSCSTFMLYLGLDHVFEKVPHHTIYLSDAVRRTDRDSLEDRTLNEKDPPFYVCNPTVTDPTNAPAGHSALYVLVPTPNTAYGVDWKAKAEPFAEHIIDRLSLVGFHGIRSHIRFKQHLTAEHWRDDYRVFRGAVFNLAHGWTQLGPLRPKSRDEDVKNLHWVGGGTHPGSGLLTIFESANIAAAHIAQDEGRSLKPSKAPNVDAPVDFLRPVAPRDKHESFIQPRGTGMDAVTST